MPWKYNGVAITAQKRNGIDITMGKVNGVEFLATDPGGPLLADWTLPAGKQSAAGGPGQFLSFAGMGIGGYPKGLWMRTIEGTTGFGELQAGSFEFTFGGVTDTLDDIKFRDDGTNSRMAVARTTGVTFAHLSNWLSVALWQRVHDSDGEPHDALADRPVNRPQPGRQLDFVVVVRLRADERHADGGRHHRIEPRARRRRAVLGGVHLQHIGDPRVPKCYGQFRLGVFRTAAHTVDTRRLTQSP